ncbi:caspase-9 [Lepisosteus oculatus]|uniref:caspase-9 n=1 Tax=Lepisosteus oculatus TaxID=7918 RepID=UPI003721CFD7
MDGRHKKILQSNRSMLVQQLDPSKLYDGLLSKGVFTQDMIDEIQSAGTRRDQARQLVRDLETRGSRAFPAFLECLQESGQGHLADALQKGVKIQPPPPVPVQPVPIPVLKYPDGNKEIPDRGDIPYHQDRPTHSPDNENYMTTSYPSQKDELDPKPQGRPRSNSLQVYKMDHNPCGHCLIINNVDFERQSGLNNRTGSDIDCDRLEKRFKAFNFVVTVKRNLKSKQIRQELTALSKKDHSSYDCCVVVILSHGSEASHCRFPGAVHGVDGPIVAVQNITNYLNGQNCPTLQGKPKLFFIQACGGDEKDTGFEVSEGFGPSSGGLDDQTDAMPMSSSSDLLSLTDEVDARASLPTPSDILVSYSTFPGYVSWRDTAAGSWYVETLDNILAQNAKDEDLVTMLMMVTDKVSQISAKGIYKQMPGSFNFLRKRLFFQILP